MNTGMPEFRLPEEETAKRAQALGQLAKTLLVHWHTNILLGIALWWSWKLKFWQDPLYRFTCPLFVLLCSLPLIDDFIEYSRAKRQKLPAREKKISS